MQNLPWWTWLIIAAWILDAILVLMLFLLKRRGITIKLRTKFGPAMIFDSEDNDGVPIRLLNVNGKFQSVGYVEEARWADLACLYHQYFAEVQDIAGTPREGLVIGGGGYSYPKYLGKTYPSLNLSVVEIDPKITEIARTHFYLDKLEVLVREGSLNLVTQDGWQYLIDSTMRYDVIVNDAFGGKKPLGPLKTKDGAKVVAEHLSERGVYLANVISSLEGKKSATLKESLEACKQHFSHIYLIPENPDEPEESGDNVLVASNHRLAIAATYRICGD